MSSRSTDRTPAQVPIGGEAPFATEVARAIATARVGDDAVCVAHLGVDGLGGVRDAHGEARAEAVLAEVGVALARSIRGGDVVARLSGDSFGLILHHCELDILDIVAARLIGQVTRLARSHPDHELAACLGVAYFSDPPHGDGEVAAAAVARRAREALDEARAQGPGKMVVRAQ